MFKMSPTMGRFVLFWIGLFVCCWQAQGQVGGSSPQESLEKEVLLSLNDSSTRPLYLTGGPVEVEVDVAMISIGHLNEMDMTWTASFYFRQEWTDPRLRVTGAQGQLLLPEVFTQTMWRPDVFFSNSEKGEEHRVTVPNRAFYVTPSTGHVLFSQRWTLTLDCDMDFRKYPLDTQWCQIKIESFSHTVTDLKLKWSSSKKPVSYLSSVRTTGYKIVGTDTKDCTTTYSTGTFPCLEVTVKLERHFGYYIYYIFLPTIVTVFLSWVSFWIDPFASVARLAVPLLAVFAAISQLSGTTEHLPRVPYVMALEVWSAVSLIFVFAAFLESAVAVSRAHKLRRWSMTHGETRNDVHGNAETGQQSSPSRRMSVMCCRLESCSRVFFPLGYIIFNIVFWIYFNA